MAISGLNFLPDVFKPCLKMSGISHAFKSQKIEIFLVNQLRQMNLKKASKFLASPFSSQLRPNSVLNIRKSIEGLKIHVRWFNKNGPCGYHFKNKAFFFNFII